MAAFGFEQWTDPALALLAALVAGAANAVAGGGTNLSFPVLVWLGLPPVVANATNAVGLWTGSLGGAWSYRARLRRLDAGLLGLAVVALVGGGVGAVLLTELPPDWFGRIAPAMVIGASAIVALEPGVRRHLPDLRPGGGAVRRGVTVAVVLVVSVYGGYFGAGVGILTLVTLALLGFDDLHEANALKNLLVAGLKGVAVAYFIAAGALHWGFAAIMLVGSTVGGWGGGVLAQRVRSETLRWIVVAIGVAMGLVMAVGTYG